MSAADAAVDGREAVTIAASLYAGRSSVQPGSVRADGADIANVAAALARLADLLGDQLTAASAGAPIAADQAACCAAARAAQRIYKLMDRGHVDGHVR